MRWCSTSQAPTRSSASDVVVLRHVRRREQRDLAGGAREDAVADQRLDRRVAGAREVVRDPELARRVPVLAVPGDREAGRGIEVALLLVEHLVEDLVDPRERRADRHRRAVVLDDLRVAREHRHAGADRGLRQVDRRDRALLELAQRVGQLVVQRGDQAAAVSRRRVVGARTQRENDRRREGVRALTDHPAAALAAHRPSRRDRPA